MKASDCKCIICGKQAVAFWPVFDPDIPSHPYCRECLDKAEMKMILELQEASKKAEEVSSSLSLLSKASDMFGKSFRNK